MRADSKKNRNRTFVRKKRAATAAIDVTKTRSFFHKKVCIDREARGNGVFVIDDEDDTQER